MLNGGYQLNQHTYRFRLRHLSQLLQTSWMRTSVWLAGYKAQRTIPMTWTILRRPNISSSRSHTREGGTAWRCHLRVSPQSHQQHHLQSLRIYPRHHLVSKLCHYIDHGPRADRQSRRALRKAKGASGIAIERRRRVVTAFSKSSAGMADGMDGVDGSRSLFNTLCFPLFHDMILLRHILSMCRPQYSTSWFGSLPLAPLRSPVHRFAVCMHHL